MQEKTTKEQPTTITFKLSKEIKYGDDGNMTSTKTLVLYSPSRADLKTARILKQIISEGLMVHRARVAKGLNLTPEIMDSVQAASDEEKAIVKKEKEPVISDDEIKEADRANMLMYIYARKESLDSFFLNFRRLMCTQCCRLNDRVHMTQALFEKIPAEDDDDLVSTYCEFFLTPRILK